MAIHVRNFIREFINFTRAFWVRWWVAMSAVLGVPLVLGSYFVSEGTLRFSLFLAGVCCLIFSSFYVWNEQHKARRKAEALVSHPLIDIKRSDLFFGQPNEKWTARIIAARNVTGVQVYLDSSEYKGGTAPNYWRPKGPRLILRKENFVKDVQVSIDLMELDNDPMRRSWRWATAMESGERPLVLLTCYRCQLVFIAAESPESQDYFDFIVTFHDGKPSLIGEHMFLYARDWKNEDARSNNTT